MDIFAEDGLKFFGIDKNVKDTGTTEIVVLEIKNMFMDYTFLNELTELLIKQIEIIRKQVLNVI